MDRLRQFLSSSVWKGVAGIFTIVGTVFGGYSIYLAHNPRAPAPLRTSRRRGTRTVAPPTS
ncbi:MAG: hypothetical protein JWN86_3242 [Planctomycetota bacterium]|nr:hypothetical protein [Planctomycetota bacterium]